MADKRAGLPAALGAAVAGTTLYRGAREAAQLHERQQDLMQKRKTDLATPMYDPTVRAVKRADYDAHAAKVADFFQGEDGEAPGLGARIQHKALDRVLDHGMRLAIDAPVNYALSKLHQRFVMGPAHERAFEAALDADPELQQVFAAKPHVVMSAHASLKKFAPDLATDPNYVRAFLHQAHQSSAALDGATLGQLLSNQKMYRGK